MLAALQAATVIQCDFISTKAPAGEGGAHPGSAQAMLALKPNHPDNIKLNKLTAIYWDQE